MARDIRITPKLNSTTTNDFPEIQFGGLSSSTIKLKVDDDGSVVYTGTYGVLFNVTDEKNGLLHSVNDISGLPILQVYSWDYVQMGKWDKYSLTVNSDKVGVGLTAPSTKFHIYATQSGAFRLQDGTQGVGYVLQSDVNGVGTWTASTVPSSGNDGSVSLRYNYGYSSGGANPVITNHFLTDDLIFGSVSTIEINEDALQGNSYDLLEFYRNWVNTNTQKLIIQITKVGDNTNFGVYLIDSCGIWVTTTGYQTVEFSTTTVLAANGTWPSFVAGSTDEYTISFSILGSNTIAGTVSSGVQGYLAYYPTTGETVDDTNNLFWDSSLYRLGVGTASPNKLLHVAGEVEIDSTGGAPDKYQSDRDLTSLYTNTTDGSIAMGVPDVWLKINVNGTDYVFPGYVPKPT